MQTISSIKQLDLTSVQNVKYLDISGSCIYNFISPFDRSFIYLRSLETIQSVEVVDISGSTKVYGVDISGAIHLSTLTGIENAFVIRLDDIDSSMQVLVNKELKNKNILNGLDFDILKKNLYMWAGGGYIDSYESYRFVLNDPNIVNGRYSCSDGIFRDVWGYIPFILGSSIQELVQSYQLKMKGISLSYSVQINPITLILHVSRA
jgi:hypothetical protein